MTQPHQSRLLSILLSTGCMVAFGLLAAPLIKPGSVLPDDIQVREALKADAPAVDLHMPAGKSVIVDSTAKITNARVSGPQLVRVVSIGEHELLLNGMEPGQTQVILVQADGRERKFDVRVEAQSAGQQIAGVRADGDTQGLTAAYRDAMTRVQTVITGVNR